MRSAAWLAGTDRRACWVRDLITSQIWAIAVPGNPLDPADPIGTPEGVSRAIERAHEVAEGRGAAWSGRLILWSGCVLSAQREADQSDDAQHFARSLAAWGPAGLDRFRSIVERLASVADHMGVRMLFRPHARHVLPDPQRCLNFLREWAATPISLLIDPGAMMERSMLRDADDHATRIVGSLIGLADGLLLSGPPALAPGESDDLDAPPMELVSLERSAFNAQPVAGLIQSAGRDDLAVVAIGDHSTAFAAVGL
jgi:hypothetical protein